MPDRNVTAVTAVTGGQSMPPGKPCPSSEFSWSYHGPWHGGTARIAVTAVTAVTPNGPGRPAACLDPSHTFGPKGSADEHEGGSR